ncbi:MAG: response regulator [Anaerolineae bacterium]
MNYQNWKVIVVEDTYDDMQVASAILTHYGVEVHVAHNGMECLDLLDSISPTFIITDLAMPEMDGWEMLSQIRDNATTSHIPVIAMTAYDSANVGEDAYKAGFNAYFPKPLSPRHLIEHLTRVLGE